MKVKVIKHAVIFAGRQMGVEKCLFLLYCECMGNNRTTLESKGGKCAWEDSGRKSNNRTTLESKGKSGIIKMEVLRRNNRTTLESKEVKKRTLTEKKQS